MEEKNRFKIYKIIMLMVLVIFITCMLTSIGMYQYFTNSKEASRYMLEESTGNEEIDIQLNNYRRVIDKYFLGEIDEEKLKEGAIKGYIEGLNDPYTEYISKEEMQEYMENTRGNFVGIGIHMVRNIKENKVQILAPIKNTPAEKAGILPGDLIISVDDVKYTGEEMSIAAAKIKGEPDSIVKLEILRPETSEILTFEIKRENIKVNPVEGKVINNNIGYIEFSSFDENTAQDFKLKYEELKKKGIKSLIIDLRNNGGGMVDEALTIAEYFVDKDSILLYEIDKNEREIVKKSKNKPFIDIETIVLTNENTASSSEILAGALKDLNKAKIVGTKTYGKGVIQQLMTLPNGSGLKITTEKYLTPNKSEINKIGIEPDEVVELPKEVKSLLDIEEKNDTQLQKAIEMLK